MCLSESWCLRSRAEVVYRQYLRWMRKLESEPVDFLSREFESRLAEARQALGDFVGANRDDLVYGAERDGGVEHGRPRIGSQTGPRVAYFQP